MKFILYTVVMVGLLFTAGCFFPGGRGDERHEYHDDHFGEHDDHGDHR